MPLSYKFKNLSSPVPGVVTMISLPPIVVESSTTQTLGVGVTGTSVKYPDANLTVPTPADWTSSHNAWNDDVVKSAARIEYVPSNSVCVFCSVTLSPISNEWRPENIIVITPFFRYTIIWFIIKITFT